MEAVSQPMFEVPYGVDDAVDWSNRIGGTRSASSRIRASSDSRPSVSKSHGSGSCSGETRCGAFIPSEHGLTEAEAGTFIRAYSAILYDIYCLML